MHDEPESTPPASDPRKRGRWQFGLSTLMLVVTACAVASWWHARQEPWEVFQERFTKRVAEFGGEITWGDGEKPTRVSFRDSVLPSSKLLLNDERLQRLQRDLARLRPWSLNLGGYRAWPGRISDHGLAHLNGLARLECLSLRYTDAVTDAGLEHLMGLQGLRLLDLRDTRVTEAGARAFAAARPDVIVLTDWSEKQTPVGVVSAAQVTVPIPQNAFGGQMVVKPQLSIGLYQSDPDVHVHWISAVDAVMSLHGPISDSGVFVARVDASDPANAKLVWQALAEPLGVDHSKYRHEVQLIVAGDRCVVVSDGAATFVEIRELATGNLLKRWVY